MRISVTDRCNLRCVYCMPRSTGRMCDTCGFGDDALTDDEIVRIVQAAAGIGIKHIRLTGGEPLLRPGLAGLVSRLVSVAGIESVDLTTNGILLADYAGELVHAGLRGVNVSLDTTDEDIFSKITGTAYKPETVIDGIDAALAAGLKVKINSVLTDVNRDCWPDLIGLVKERNSDIRFIELMPIGNGRDHTGVSNPELKKWITGRYGKLKESGCEHSSENTGMNGITGKASSNTGGSSNTGKSPDISHGNGPAQYYRLPGYRGCIGFISAIHGKFCDSCNRIRLTSAGILKSCLCYDSDIDLRRILRNSADTDEIAAVIAEAIRNKPKAHCFESPEMIPEHRSMSQIGG